MKPEEHEYIDSILSEKDETLPSSGFSASVMEAVRQEAAAPPPIAFPWKRALPGIAVGVLTLLLVVAGCFGVWGGMEIPAQPSVLDKIFAPVFNAGGLWAVAVLAVSLAALWLSRRLVQGGAGF